jgi:multiple sugar transport system substrate-binding protein
MHPRDANSRRQPSPATSTFALAVVALLAAGGLLTACTAPGAPEDKILIEFWDFPRLPAVQEWLLQTIDEYERLNPQVHIEFTRLSWSKGGERMDIAAFAGRPPDVAGSVLNLKYVQAGLLASLDDYLDEEIPDMPGVRWRDDIHPPILKDMQWEGRTWAFPWYKEGFVILLNRDILEERGVDPPAEGHWTWEEFLEAMRRLTFDRDGDGTTDVYGIGYNTGRQKWEAYSFLFAEGMRILSDDQREQRIDSPATRRGIQRLLTLEYDEKVALPGAGGITDSTTWSAFSGPERRLAATCQGLWAIKATEIQNQRLEEFKAENPEATDLPDPVRIAVALYPQMPGQPQRMASYGVGCLMVFNRPYDPKRTREAARFARYITLQAGQLINREAGLFPSRISTGNLFDDDPRYKSIWPYIPDAISPPVHPAWFQLDQVIGEQLQLALLKRIGVDEAVTRMGNRMQMILDDFWASYDAAHEEEEP